MYSLNQIYQSNNAAPFRVDLYSWQEAVTNSMTFMAITFSDPNLRKCFGLVDCGIKQEDSDENDNDNENEFLHFDPKILDFIVITHPHADHIARLPMLYNQGCKAKIYMSHMTNSLLEIALPDAEKIMLANTKLKGRKPWYNSEDTQSVLDNSVGKTFFSYFEVAENVKCMLIDNGHVMGASSVYFEIMEEGFESINYFFTGDYKPSNPLKITRGIRYIADKLDIRNKNVNIVTESTYGKMGRFQKRDDDLKNNSFIEEVLKGIEDSKSIFVPTLALERPLHELLELKKAQDNGMLSTDIPIYVAGKLLKGYLPICSRYSNVDFIPQNVRLLDQVSNKVNEEGYQLISELQPNKTPKIVIASSGMCQYGAAVSILHEYLPNINAKIIFTCYLAQNTLGQQIRDAQCGEMVSIAGCMTKRLAEVAETSQFSGHASPYELIELLKSFGSIKFIGIHHGDFEAKRDFAMLLNKEFPGAKIAIMGDGYFFRTSHWGLVTSKKIPKKFEI